MANNKDKNKEVEIFYDLDSWLRDALGQNALGHDNLDVLKNIGFQKEVETGNAIHGLENELRSLTAFASSHYGLYPVIKRLPNNQGSRIIYRPRGAGAENIPDSDCPFIEIARTGQNGRYTLRDGMLNPNSALLVRGRNGEIGLASALSTGIAQVLEDWKANDAVIRQQINGNKVEGLKYLQRKTSKSVMSVKQLTSGVYSTHQIKEYEELNDKSINNLRPEALWAMMTHVITGHYQRQLFNANKAKRGAPTVEQFVRDIENIMNASRGFKDAQQVSNYVKQNYSWIYHNIWKGDFENVFKSFAGKMSQSGMTEGTVGKFGLMEVEAALASLSAPGKKLKQNAQILAQRNTFLKNKNKAKAATGMTSVMSKRQFEQLSLGKNLGFFSEDDFYKDVYTTATLSKESLTKARENLKRLYGIRKTDAGQKEIKERYGLDAKAFEKLYKQSMDMFLKGFGDDGSFMGEDLAKDFKGIKDPKHLPDYGVKFDDVNTYIRESVLESKKRRLEKLKDSTSDKDLKEIEKLNKEIEIFSQENLNVLEKISGKYKYGKEHVYDKLQNYLRNIYQLDDTYKIEYQGKPGDVLSNLVATRARHNETSVFRAGLTADERTTKSLIDNLYAAEAMLQEGYDTSEVYRDINQKLNSQGGLKAQNFIEASAINNKNIRSYIMRVLTHVNTQLRDVQGMSGEDISKIFKENPFFKELFKSQNGNQIFSIDNKTGMLLVDNNALDKRLEEKRKTDAEFATNMLFAAVEVGKAAKVYDKDKTYFGKYKVGEKTYITTENPLLFSEELGLSSAPEWMNLGRGSNSVSKIGINELSSLEATVGEFSQFLLDHGYTSGNKDPNKDYDAAMKPMRGYLDAVHNEMEDKKKEYQKYVDNTQLMKKTFSRQAEQFQKDVRADQSIVKLNLDDLIKMNYDLEYNSLDKGGMLVEGLLEDSNFVGPYLKRKRQERFDEILKIKNDQEEWNKLSEQEKRQYEKINSLGDLKNFALDLGDERLTAVIGSDLYDTKEIILPYGEYSEGINGTYMPDEGLKYATRVLRSVNEFFNPENLASRDREREEKRTIEKIKQEYKDYGKEVASGKTHDKYHTITGGKGSGYLLLQGMTEDSSEVFKDILGKDSPELQNISRVISTADLTAMLRQEIKDDKKNVLNMYKELFQHGPGKKSEAKIIQDIVDAVDISKKDKKTGKRIWGGQVLNSFWSNRNPTINFINDLIGGAIVATSNDKLVAQGRMLINKHYAAIGKGDMDGDLVTLFNALNAGDFQAAGAALNSFFTHKREYQKEIQEKEAEEEAKTLEDIKKHIEANNPSGTASKVRAAEDISKANSVLDKEEKNITIAAAWLGKQGAGRYGNAKFTAEDIIRETIGSEGRQRKDLAGLGARVFGAVYQSLYQKGINIKNLKRDENGNVVAMDEEAARVYGKMLSTMDMATSSGVWKDERLLRTFLYQAKDLGVFKEDSMFEGATLQTLGLDDLIGTSKDKQLLNQLQVLAENTKEKLIKTFGEDSKQVELIEKDIQKIKEVQEATKKKIHLHDLSLELGLTILQGDYEGSFKNLVSHHDGIGLATKIGQMWQRIPGYMSSRDNLIPILGTVYGKGNYDAGALSKVSEVFEAAKRQEAQGISYESEINKINKGHLKYHSSPSNEISKTIGTTKKYPKESGQFGKLIDALKTASPEESKEILRKIHSLNPTEKDIQGIEDTTRGLVSHKVAELLASDLGKEENIDSWIFGNEAYDFLKKYDPEFLERYKRRLKYSNPDRYDNALAREDFLKKAAHKGVANFRVQRSLAGPNAKMLGAEIPLVGYSRVSDKGDYVLSHQIADAMWTEEDENGNLTLHISDLKNPENGQASITHALQIKDYARSMQLLKAQVDEFGKQGITIDSADAFFAQDNEFTRNWYETLKRAAEEDAGVSEGVEFEKALEARKAKFEEQLKIAKQGYVKTVGHIIASGNNGYINTYDVDLFDEKLEDLFSNKYLLTGKPISEFVDINGEEANIAFNSAVKHTGTHYGGTVEDAAKLHTKELDGLKERYDIIIEIQKKVNELKLREQILSREIDSPEARLKVEKLAEELAKKEEELKEATKSFNDELTKFEGKIKYADNGQMLVDASGTSVGGLLAAEMDTHITNKAAEAKDDYKKTHEKIYFESLIGHLDEFEKQSKIVAGAEAAFKSPLLKGKNKTAIKRAAKDQYEVEKEKLQIIQNNIQTEMKLLAKDEEGNIINPYTQQKADSDYNINRNFDKIKKENLKIAKQSQALKDRQHIVSYEQAVLNYEKQRYSFEDEIAEKEDLKAKAQKENNTAYVEQLEKEIELLGRIKELTLEQAKLDLKHMKGSNPASEKNMKELAALIHERDLQKSFSSALAKNGVNNAGGAGGAGSFLGIDSATTRWLSRIMNGGLIYSFIRLVRRGFRDITNQAKQLDQAMTNLRIVTGKNASDARTLMGQYSELGKQLGATTIEITQSATAWLRQGYDISQINDLIKSSMYLSKLGMIDSTEATKNLTSALHGFKLEASQAMDVVDKLTALDVKAATTAGDIAQGLSQFANIANLGGVSIDQAAAYVATIADVNQMSGITVGQSLNFYGDLRG